MTAATEVPAEWGQRVLAWEVTIRQEVVRFERARLLGAAECAKAVLLWSVGCRERVMRDPATTRAWDLVRQHRMQRATWPLQVRALAAGKLEG